MNRLDDAHVIERDMEVFVRQISELAATEASAAECLDAVAVGPFHGAKDVRTIAGAADGDQKVAGARQVLQLLDENAIEAFIVAPGENVGSVIGEADDAQPFLAIIIEVVARQGALAEVFAKMRRVGAAAAVADDKDKAATFVAFEDRVRQCLHLGRLDAEQFLTDTFKKRPDRQFATEHVFLPYNGQIARPLYNTLMSKNNSGMGDIGDIGDMAAIVVRY